MHTNDGARGTTIAGGARHESTSRAGSARSVVERIRARARSSPWTPLVGRAGVVVLALFVLAWIGRAATAATPASAPVGEARAAPIHPDGPARASPVEPLATATSATPTVASSTATAEAPPLTAAAPTAARGQARATPDDPVFLNYASAEELLRLPGAGPKRAGAIVALRQRMGRFQRVEDLLRVKGIGRATLRKWRPLIRLDMPAKPAGDAGTSETADGVGDRGTRASAGAGASGAGAGRHPISCRGSRAEANLPCLVPPTVTC